MEDFVTLPSDDLEAEIAAVQSQQYDRHTGPYPYDTLGDWKRMVDKLTPAILGQHGVAFGKPIYVPDDAVSGIDGARADDDEEILQADPRLRDSAWLSIS
jgi:hypothetical protein